MHRLIVLNLPLTGASQRLLTAITIRVFCIPPAIRTELGFRSLCSSTSPCFPLHLFLSLVICWQSSGRTRGSGCSADNHRPDQHPGCHARLGVPGAHQRLQVEATAEGCNCLPIELGGHVSRLLNWERLHGNLGDGEGKGWRGEGSRKEGGW